jgi:hypothetical protein
MKKKKLFDLEDSRTPQCKTVKCCAGMYVVCLPLEVIISSYISAFTVRLKTRRFIWEYSKIGKEILLRNKKESIQKFNVLFCFVVQKTVITTAWNMTGRMSH